MLPLAEHLALHIFRCPKLEAKLIAIWVKGWLFFGRSKVGEERGFIGVSPSFGSTVYPCRRHVSDRRLYDP
jgi:hypothetical protein